MRRFLILLMLVLVFTILSSCDLEEVFSGIGTSEAEGSNIVDTDNTTESPSGTMPNDTTQSETSKDAEPCVHDFSKATCQVPMTCIHCGITEGEPREHSWKGPFCNLPVHCGECGYSESEELGDHEWSSPNCTYPKMCHFCGLTEGEPNDEHSWLMAPCIKVNMCSICYKTDGEPKGEHKWIEASCTSPKWCIECMITEGEPNGEHVWIEADCSRPKMCAHCNLTEGEKVGEHKWVKATCGKPKICTVCGETEGEPTGEHRYEAATCTHAKTCYDCGHTEGVPDENNHDWREADCAPKRCTRCDVRVGESLGLPHNFKGGGCYILSTCTECGEKGDFVHQFGKHYGEDNYCRYCLTILDSEGLTYAPYGDGYQVTGMGSCTDKYIKIPETYNGKPVVSIKAKAFYYDTLDIYIPKTVTHIGEGALGYGFKIHYMSTLEDWAKVQKDCRVDYRSENGTIFFNELYGIVLGKYKLYIDDKLVESIVVPESMTVIPDYAFAGMEVKSIVLHDGITKIGKGAFMNVGYVLDYTIPVEENEFLNIVIPSSVKEIDNWAFFYADLKTVVIPSSVEKIGMYAFAELSGEAKLYTEHTSMPAGWHSFWSKVFDDTYLPDHVYWQGEWSYVNGVPKVK